MGDPLFAILALIVIVIFLVNKYRANKKYRRKK